MKDELHNIRDSLARLIERLDLHEESSADEQIARDEELHVLLNLVEERAQEKLATVDDKLSRQINSLAATVLSLLAQN